MNNQKGRDTMIYLEVHVLGGMPISFERRMPTKAPHNTKSILLLLEPWTTNAQDE